MKRKSTLLVLATMCLMGLAGCGTSSSNLGSSSIKDNSSQPASSNTPSSAPSSVSSSVSSSEVHVHTLEKVEAKDPTCTETGLLEHYKCSECGKLFSDSEGKTETTLEQVTVKALGHDFVADETNYKELTCSRGDMYRHLYEFDECDSNAWRGGEYDDKIWKIPASGIPGTSGDYYVGRINDNSVDPDLQGKTWLEFKIKADQEMSAEFNIRAALGSEWMYKKAFKVEVNGTQIDVGEEKIAGEYKDWNHFEMFTYSAINLIEGQNTIRLTIMESAPCNLDYAAVDTVAPLDKHTHEYVQETEGKNDVMVCSCGGMHRKLDLAASFSESWSEGTAKTDSLWRQLNGAPGILDSGNYVSHIGDVVNDGTHDGEYWIEIGVSFEGNEDITGDLSLCAGMPGATPWSTMNIIVNNAEIEKEGNLGNSTGWNDFKLNNFGAITLKHGQVNTIKISPNKDCLMNWVYLELDTSIATTNSTNTLIEAAQA